MSQATTCRHGVRWEVSRAPHCAECRDMRLGFIRAAMQGLVVGWANDESVSLKEVANLAVRLADRTLEAAEEVR